MRLFNKYAIVEWTPRMGHLTPEIVDSGSLWRLIHKLIGWQKSQPYYPMHQFFEHKTLTAEVWWTWGLRTKRKIVRIGKDDEHVIKEHW